MTRALAGYGSLLRGFVDRIRIFDRERNSLPGIGSINRAKADALLALFDEGGDFALAADGHAWTYKGRVSYGLMKRNNVTLSDEQHRLSHVMHHTFEDAGRMYNNKPQPHGAFSDPVNMFDLIDETFLHPDDVTPLPNGRKRYTGTFESDVGTSNFDANAPSRVGSYRTVRTVQLLIEPNGSSAVSAYPVPP